MNFDASLGTVNVDADQLWQAMLNLIRNSLEAMPNGGVMTVSTQRDGDQVLLQVTDTGTGMSEEQVRQDAAAAPRPCPGCCSRPKNSNCRSGSNPLLPPLLPLWGGPPEPPGDTEEPEEPHATARTVHARATKSFEVFMLPLQAPRTRTSRRDVGRIVVIVRC